MTEKYCDNNNKDKDISPNNVNKDNSLSQKFRQNRSVSDVYKELMLLSK